MSAGRRIFLPLIVAALATTPFASNAAAQAPADDIEVILAIDTSGSMQPAVVAAKAAAAEFVATMPDDVRIGVETFADTVTVLTPPTADRALVIEQIDSITAAGDTALYDVVVNASQHFSPTADHKVLVVLSDGKDEGSLATLDDATNAIALGGLHVEAISLTTAETDLFSLGALGPVTSADDPAGVSAAFARVASLVVEVIEPTTVPTSAPPATTTAPATTVAATAAAVVTAPQPPSPAAVVTPEASTSSVWLWVGGIGIFVGLFLLTLLLFPKERVSKARLGIEKPRSVSDIGTRGVSAIEVALERHGKTADLSTTLAVADISMKPAEFVAMVVIVAAVAGLVGLLLAGPIIAVLVAAAVCLGVRVYVHRAKVKRQTAFADQLPDVLQLVTNALRSGFGLTQALESVAEEAEEPARSEFAHVLIESQMGRDLSESMHALAQRMDSKDLEWVVSAIDINRETGGNLSEILQKVGTTVRERGRMARNVRTLTAEGRLSARILTVVPLLLLVWQWRVNPDNFALLTHGAGLAALIVAGILMILGGTWVYKIVNSVAL